MRDDTHQQLVARAVDEANVAGKRHGAAAVTLWLTLDLAGERTVASWLRAPVVVTAVDFGVGVAELDGHVTSLLFRVP